MTVRPLPAVLAALLALAGCQLVPGAASPGSAPGSTKPQALRVTSVADGDTFTGKDATGKKVKVRMLSIDAPELAHDGNSAACGSKQAAARLRTLLSGQTVDLVADPEADPVDKYGRRLAYVELDGRDIALQLVSEGLVEAWYPKGEPRPVRFDTYSGAEATAKHARTGSWRTCPSLGR